MAAGFVDSLATQYSLQDFLFAGITRRILMGAFSVNEQESETFRGDSRAAEPVNQPRLRTSR